MITDLLLRYGLGIALVVAVIKVLSAMLRVSESPMYVARVALMYLGLPLVFWVVWLYPTAGAPLAILILLLDPRFFVGHAIMSILHPFFVLCTFSHVIRSVVTKRPLISRRYVHPLLATYFLLALACYLRDPALPTFGRGQGSGFANYVSFFSSFLPFVFLPGMVSRRMLERLPHFVMWACAGTALFHTLIVIFGSTQVQLVFIAPERLVAAEQGRFSYLSSSAKLMLVSCLCILAFSRSRHLFVRPVAALGVAGGLLGIVMTGTRSLLVACVAAMLCIFAAKRWWGRVIACASVLIILLIVRITLPTTDVPVFRSVMRSINFVTSDRGYAQAPFQFQNVETMRWRLSVWEGGLRSVRKYPFLGRGFSGKYNRGLSPYLLPAASQREISVESSLDIGATHNLWLAPFVSFGIPAGICFCLFVGMKALRLLKLAFSLRPGDPFHVTAQFLLTWLATMVALSVANGGTVATELFLLLALSTILEEHAGDATDPDCEGTPAASGEEKPPSGLLAPFV